MPKLFLLIFLFLISSVSLAAFDREIIESSKCSRLFTYFEKKYRIPLDTLHAISLQESGKAHSKYDIRIVWPWTANVEGQGYYFSTKKEAVNFVRKQLIAGRKSIDVGCMQINLKHHPDAFSSLEHAFDPIKNINYSAEFLRSKYDYLGNWLNAIGHYHSATHELGSKYKQNVLKIADNMDKYKFYLKYYSKSSYYNNISYTKAPNGENRQKTPPYKRNFVQKLPNAEVKKNTNIAVNNRQAGMNSFSENKNQTTRIKNYQITKDNNPYRKISLYDKNRSNMMVHVPSNTPANN